jgi:adenine C2-methylase RlmN of 23S rRNA A2503 and tRNA A37
MLYTSASCMTFLTTILLIVYSNLQVGCPLKCTFCATGKGGFFRSLKPHEIVEQVKS